VPSTDRRQMGRGVDLPPSSAQKPRPGRLIKAGRTRCLSEQDTIRAEMHAARVSRPRRRSAQAHSVARRRMDSFVSANRSRGLRGSLSIASRFGHAAICEIRVFTQSRAHKQKSDTRSHPTGLASCESPNDPLQSCRGAAVTETSSCSDIVSPGRTIGRHVVRRALTISQSRTSASRVSNRSRRPTRFSPSSRYIVSCAPVRGGDASALSVDGA